jgi:hypothetical protein
MCEASTSEFLVAGEQYLIVCIFIQFGEVAIQNPNDAVIQKRRTHIQELPPAMKYTEHVNLAYIAIF